MPDDFDMGTPAKTPAQLYSDGLSAFANHQFDEALAAYQQALEAAASDPALHEKCLFELGRTYVKKANAKSAVEKFSELLRTYAQGALTRKAMIQLAEIYERARDNARAASLYEKASRIPPQDKEANIALQKANQLKGQK
jgi:outer membrane protein assembly factor BamD (BamD/ComL family)